MGFNFGGFMGGLSEGIYEGIEKEEERVNMLADKALDQFTQDRRLEKAKREAATKAAEEHLYTLQTMGYDLPTAAHIAKGGQASVDYAKTVVETYGNTHDVNAIYNLQPDESTANYDAQDWVRHLVGKPNQFSASDYLGPAGDYKTLFSQSAREKLESSMQRDQQTEEVFSEGKFGTFDMQLPKTSNIKYLGSMAAIQAKNFQDITHAIANDLPTTALLEEKKRIEAVMAKEGKEGGYLTSINSLKSYMDLIRASNHPNTDYKTDDDGFIMFDQQYAESVKWLEGEGATIDAMKASEYYETNKEFKYFVDQQVNSLDRAMAKQARTAIDDYADAIVAVKNAQEADLSDNEIQNIKDEHGKNVNKYVQETFRKGRGGLTLEQEVKEGIARLQAKAQNGGYAEGAVIHWKHPDGPQGMMLWTGSQVLFISKSAIENYNMGQLNHTADPHATSDYNSNRAIIRSFFNYGPYQN